MTGASFNTFLDALDGTYCGFEGGDDPIQDAFYPDNYPNGYHSESSHHVFECDHFIAKTKKDPTDCGITKPANVISTSYGYNEADLSPFYTSRQCAEYKIKPLSVVCLTHKVFQICEAGIDGGHGYLFVR